MKKLLFLLLITTNSNAQDNYAGLNYWEDINKTMSSLNDAFNTNSPNKLRDFSTESFIKSEKYRTLKELVKSNHLVFSNITETAHTKFIIHNLHNKKKNTQNLIITLTRGQDRYWYVDDAKIEDDSNFQNQGFKPLAVEYYFSDILANISSGDIDSFLGLAPYGKINKDYLSKNQLEATNEATIHIKNIVVVSKKNSNIINDFYYAELKYIPENNYSSDAIGWLLSDFDSMSNFHQDNNEDPYIKYITSDRDASKVNLDNKNPYSFITTSIIENNETSVKSNNTNSQLSSIHLQKIKIDHINWGNFFETSLDYYGPCKKPELKIADNNIQLTFDDIKSIEFTEDFSYNQKISSSVSDNTLTLSLKGLGVAEAVQISDLNCDQSEGVRRIRFDTFLKELPYK